MSTLGQTTFATLGQNFHVCADLAHTRFKAGGGTLNFTPVTAEAADRTLTSGRVVKAGDKVMEAGTIVFLSAGYYIPALTASTIVRGEVFILDTDAVLSDAGGEVTGSLFDNGPAYYSRIRVGGTGLSAANMLVAFPGVEFVKD
ncbi:MAG: hypothetical protein M3R07_08040 [Gemmatimonadota bacterium]|nr:hypothetical protein [Gemmatimonadota bacterium]